MGFFCGNLVDPRKQTWSGQCHGQSTMSWGQRYYYYCYGQRKREIQSRKRTAQKAGKAGETESENEAGTDAGISLVANARYCI